MNTPADTATVPVTARDLADDPTTDRLIAQFADIVANLADDLRYVRGKLDAALKDIEQARGEVRVVKGELP